MKKIANYRVLFKLLQKHELFEYINRIYFGVK